MKNLGKFVVFFILFGGINWGLVGLFQFNLIDYIFGETWIDRALYIAIGFSAVYQVVNWKKKA